MYANNLFLYGTYELAEIWICDILSTSPVPEPLSENAMKNVLSAFL